MASSSASPPATVASSSSYVALDELDYDEDDIEELEFDFARPDKMTLAVDTPYISFADKIFKRYKDYYYAARNGKGKNPISRSIYVLVRHVNDDYGKKCNRSKAGRVFIVPCGETPVHFLFTVQSGAKRSAVFPSFLH